MSERCAPRAQRFHNGVSCLSMGLVRDILKEIKQRSAPAVVATIRPYAKAHSTKAGLFQHLVEVIGNANNEGWGDDVHVAGEAMRQQIRRAFKPMLVVGHAS
jgi:hypothetical protein